MKKGLKEGDKVVMTNCIEADYSNGKIWTCRSDEIESKSGHYVIFLEGFSGSFLTKFLQFVDISTINTEKA